MAVGGYQPICVIELVVQLCPHASQPTLRNTPDDEALPTSLKDVCGIIVGILQRYLYNKRPSGLCPPILISIRRATVRTPSIARGKDVSSSLPFQ